MKLLKSLYSEIWKGSQPVPDSKVSLDLLVVIQDKCGIQRIDWEEMVKIGKCH